MIARKPLTIRPSIWIALATVYLVWGSTYLAIRVAVSTLPPLLMAATRFLVAGAILWTVIYPRLTPAQRPSRHQWRSSAIVGAALLLGGNGGVVWAEQTVASGPAALIVATVPLFMVLIDRFVLGQRLLPAAWAGIVLGFAGVALLIGPVGAGRVDPLGALVLVGASLSWSAGSVYATRARLPENSLLGTSMQMLAGGAALLIAGLIGGELRQLDPAGFSRESLAALVYLVVFGSLAGFTAYVWLLKVERTSVVSTYAYVNPVVAVLLGWLILAEHVNARTLLAGGLIVGAVALIVTARGPRHP